MPLGRRRRAPGLGQRHRRASPPSGKCAVTVLVDVWRIGHIHQNGDRYLLIELVNVAFAQHIHKFYANGRTGTTTLGDHLGSYRAGDSWAERFKKISSALFRGSRRYSLSGNVLLLATARRGRSVQHDLAPNPSGTERTPSQEAVRPPTEPPIHQRPAG